MRSVDIIPSPTDVSVESLYKEDQLAIALNASMDTALEEQVAFITVLQVAYQFLFFLLFPFLFFGSSYPNVCVPTVFPGGLLLGKMSGTTKVLNEAMEVLAPVWRQNADREGDEVFRSRF